MNEGHITAHIHKTLREIHTWKQSPSITMDQRQWTWPLQQKQKFQSCAIILYRQISNIRRTNSQTLNVSRLVLQLSLPNPLKSGIKSRMKMYLEERRQAMLQLHMSDQQCYCLVGCVLYKRFYGNCVTITCCNSKLPYILISCICGVSLQMFRSYISRIYKNNSQSLLWSIVRIPLCRNVYSYD